MIAWVSLAIAQVGGSAWLPVEASRSADAYDLVFRALLIGAGTALALLLLGADIMLYRFLRGDDAARGRDADPSAVWPWTIGLVALASALVLFDAGLRAHVDRAVAPIEALTVNVTGDQGGWNFDYGSQVVTDTLRVPTERPVKLRFAAADLPQRFSIPALRVEHVVRADRPTEVWFEPTVADTFAVYGSAVEGADYDSLVTAAHAQAAADFELWMLAASNPLLTMEPVDAGKALLQRNGCLVCHTVDGSKLTGPSFFGVLGRERRFVDQTTAVVDSAYVRRSILEPLAQVVEGFGAVMPSFQGRLGDSEIAAILAYFETLVPADESTPGEGGR